MPPASVAASGRFPRNGDTLPHRRGSAPYPCRRGGRTPRRRRSRPRHMPRARRVAGTGQPGSVGTACGRSSCTRRAVEVEADAADEIADRRFGEARIGAGGTRLDAFEAGLDTRCSSGWRVGSADGWRSFPVRRPWQAPARIRRAAGQCPAVTFAASATSQMPGSTSGCRFATRSASSAALTSG